MDVLDIPRTRAAEGLDRRAFTVADLERMIDSGLIGHDERLELVGGEIVPMAAKGIRHEVIKGALNRRWGRVCPDGFVVMPETGLHLDPQTYLEPDFLIFRRAVRLADVRGPDVLLVVEVADASLDYDLGRKPALYARFGIAELWVIDAARRLVHVHRGPGRDGYATVSVAAADASLRPTRLPEAFALRLDDLEAI